jgi:hypothetical protein
MDDARAGLIVLLLRAPEVLESGEGGENGTTDPDGVLALRGCNNLDLHRGRREGGQLFLHTIGNTGEHGGTTRKDNVAVEITTDIEIALEDGVVTIQMLIPFCIHYHDIDLRRLVDTGSFKTKEGRLEESLGCTEAGRKYHEHHKSIKKILPGLTARCR